MNTHEEHLDKLIADLTEQGERLAKDSERTLIENADFRDKRFKIVINTVFPYVIEIIEIEEENDI